MGCGECDRLRAEHERVERAYASAIEVLAARSGISAAVEYTRLRAIADKARIDLEVARLELERHKRIHSKAN